MPQLRGAVNGARGLRRATLANTRRRASCTGVARACSSYTQVLTCKPPPVRGCGRPARTRYIKRTLMHIIKSGVHTISPYAARHLYWRARVRYAALLIKGLRGQLDKRGLHLPHAGRCLDPCGDAAPWPWGRQCASRRAPSAGSPRRRVHWGQHGKLLNKRDKAYCG
jgi:hypothetical protein